MVGARTQRAWSPPPLWDAPAPASGAGQRLLRGWRRLEEALLRPPPFPWRPAAGSYCVSRPDAPTPPPPAEGRRRLHTLPLPDQRRPPAGKKSRSRTLPLPKGPSPPPPGAGYGRVRSLATNDQLHTPSRDRAADCVPRSVVYHKRDTARESDTPRGLSNKPRSVSTNGVFIKNRHTVNGHVHDSEMKELSAQSSATVSISNELQSSASSSQSLERHESLASVHDELLQTARHFSDGWDSHGEMSSSTRQPQSKVQRRYRTLPLPYASSEDASRTPTPSESQPRPGRRYVRRPKTLPPRSPPPPQQAEPTALGATARRLAAAARKGRGHYAVPRRTDCHSLDCSERSAPSLVAVRSADDGDGHYAVPRRCVPVVTPVPDNKDTVPSRSGAVSNPSQKSNGTNSPKRRLHSSEHEVTPAKSLQPQVNATSVQDDTTAVSVGRIYAEPIRGGSSSSEQAERQQRFPKCKEHQHLAASLPLESSSPSPVGTRQPSQKKNGSRQSSTPKRRLHSATAHCEHEAIPNKSFQPRTNANRLQDDFVAVTTRRTYAVPIRGGSSSSEEAERRQQIPKRKLLHPVGPLQSVSPSPEGTDQSVDSPNSARHQLPLAAMESQLGFAHSRLGRTYAIPLRGGSSSPDEAEQRRWIARSFESIQHCTGTHPQWTDDSPSPLSASKSETDLRRKRALFQERKKRYRSLPLPTAIAAAASSSCLKLRKKKPAACDAAEHRWSSSTSLSGSSPEDRRRLEPPPRRSASLGALHRTAAGSPSSEDGEMSYRDRPQWHSVLDVVTPEAPPVLRCASMPALVATAVGGCPWRKGDLVWFDPGVGHALPGEVLEYHRAAQVLSVQAVISGKPQVFTLTSLAGVKRRQDLGQTGIDDMIQLSDLNEASLLWNLKIRYDRELIYTYTGSILVAVNPYKMFDIYGLDMVKKYEGQILGTLPPHLFAVGAAAYSHLHKEGMPPENQVVVISGESGSGKTESTKLVMQYLAAVNKAPSNLITEQILEASPLLESFGNAKTVRNDNSSRFGKYLEVHFKDGVIIGAKITEYLLEKSRIVTQAPEERNYHVFYEMLRGLPSDQREKYGLLSPDKYFYLNQGGNVEIDGKADNEDFQSLLSAMQVLGLSSEEQDTIFKILASVLHLGNVYFHRKQLKHGTEGVEIGSDAEIRWTGHLLQLSVDGIKRSLTTKTTEARGERVFTPLSIDQALDARDAFAKALYSTLFSWLVSRINQIVFKGTKRTAAISILDIFGFEDFKENSFEQLCINYANENLQFYFNKHIFKLEQQEYAKEKIEWQTITYTDNLPVIHLISKKPVGILHLLDDESNFPKATDISFLEKCHYNHALDELYSRPRMSGSEFGIRHYAGQVWYNVDGFLDKNRDTLRPDVVELLISSKLNMLSKMFHSLRSSHEAAKTINKANGRFVTMKPRTPTVAARFHDSLQHLLDSMSKCNPWFVRCIKPNNDKAPMKFDMPIVLEQLRYTGMLETIRIRKMGYPVRLKFAQFVERYRYLLPHRGRTVQRGTPFRELCRVILETAASGSSDYQLGTSRVFLREGLERRLERERAEVVKKAAVTVQRHVRGWLARRRYRAIRRSAVVIQAHLRGWSARRKYRTIRHGVIRAQALFRGRRQRVRYKQLKEELKRRAEVEKVARERARVKAQREEQERASRAVAGVNHLEIPAELAFIFSKLDDWQQVHSERNLVKVVGGVQSSAQNEKYHLPHDIDHYAFTKFTNVYFKSHLWGMKREPIKTPFLAKSKDIDYQDSLAIFKLILRFMNDNNLSGKKEIALGDYIANKGIINEKMRDEILCQLCNQTWKNDNDANNERGWLLIANCLSVFPPSKTLYKYLLKYVSDNAYDGYKALCQRKLLQSARVESQLARTYPPCLLEWRSNRKRVNMALTLHFADEETRTAAVDSWTTCEALAASVVRERGIPESSGWTVALEGGTGGNGLEYALDLISEMELMPAFPACKNPTFGGSPAPRQNVNKVVTSTPNASPVPGDAEPTTTPRRPAVPPPEPPVHKQPVLDVPTPAARREEPRVRSQSRDHTVHQTGLSRKSALNDRYFEDKGRSRSLDNLLEADVAVAPAVTPSKLSSLGLSQSRLNERYHSIEKVDSNSTEPGMSMMLTAVSNKEYMTKSEALLEENLESVSQRGENSRKYSHSARSAEMNGGHASSSAALDQLPSDLLDAPRDREELALDFDYHDLVSQSRSEDDKGSYVRPGHPRFIKSHYAGKRAAPGSHSSRAYIETRNSEKSEYGGKSSALSDTSEAPSLASHVRRVRVPSQASDVDQFLDDLFMPVLDGSLDELSDARSLAASIKGGGSGKTYEDQDMDDSDHEVASLTSQGNRWQQENRVIDNVDDYIKDLFRPIFINSSLRGLTEVSAMTEAIKGGGGMETQQTSAQQQTTAAFGFTPIGSMTSPAPVVMSGMMSPPPVMMPSLPMFSPAATLMPAASSSLPYMATGGVTGAPFYSAVPDAMGQQQNFMPVPIYSMQGLSLPTPFGGAPAVPASAPGVDPGVAAAYQRAFLQTAMAQNMQIQQQLLAQSQALQQMLTQPAAQLQMQQMQVQMQQQQQQAQQPASHHLVSGLHQYPAPPPVPAYDSIDRSSKVSFREPENGELWSTEKRQTTSVLQYPATSNSMNGPTSKQPPKPPQIPHQGSPLKEAASSPRKISPTKNPQSAFTNVLSELKNRKSSVESTASFTKAPSPGMAPPPPPPPMPPPPDHSDPSEARPFLDPYGRAKTVRIGKWRWPPPKNESEDPNDSFLQFKLRQHQRKNTPQSQQQYSQEFGDMTEGIEWEEFEIPERGGRVTSPSPRKDSHSSKPPETSPNKEKSSAKAFEVGASRPAPGSIGKLRISSEMRSKLEMVTANHSIRASNKPEKPAVLPTKREDARPVRKLEDNRRHMLEQQLTGRWDSVDSVADIRGVSKEERSEVQQTNIVRSQVERMEKTTPNRMEEKLPTTNGWDRPISTIMADKAAWDKGIGMSGWETATWEREREPWERHTGVSPNSGWDTKQAPSAASSWRPAPPPPPVTPHFIDTSPTSRASSFYSQSNTNALPRPRSPPPPVQPGGFSQQQMQQQHTSYQQVAASNRLADRDRRSSASTHLTDRMERIEIEESSEFLQPVDSAPPPAVERQDPSHQLEAIKTVLFPPSTAAYFTYNRVAWRLIVRKEVFTPSEVLTSPLALHLVFCQVVQDCLSTGCLRISRDQRTKMRKLLDNYGVNLSNIHSAQQKVTIKKNVVDIAKDWPIYFARIFPVSGGHQHPGVQHLAVSHSGVRLVRQDKASSSHDALSVTDTFSFDEIAETSVPKSSAIQLILTSGVRILLYTHRANQIQSMIDRFQLEYEKLHQKQQPVISALDGYHHQPQQQQTQVQHQQAPLQQHQHQRSSPQHGSPRRTMSPPPAHNHLDAWTGRPQHTGNVLTTAHELAQQQYQHQQHTLPNQHDGKHSLLQFAMLHFRQSPEKFEMLKAADGSISGSLKVIESLKSKKNKSKKGNKENEWTWKEQVDLVKFSSSPIEQSLLRLDSVELNDLAIECFVSIMRYMGDLPMPADITEVKCVYTILMHCHKHEQLRDEVYCQLMKQTTNNKSTRPDSCQRGWRLFSIVAAYFVCSDVLRPYLFKYLETAAYDKRRAYHGTATVCLHNLRKTFKYGGRKNVPSVEEITAISAGRNSKRQIYRLPGGTERVVNTKCTTVVQDVIEEMCAMINVQSPAEMDEFSLYCIVEGDTFTMPLAREEYVLDVTTELHKNQQVFYLIFCRSVWHFPLRLDSHLYIEVVFNQIAPDYLEGLLLVMPGEQLEQDVIYDIAKMAALLHRAADMTHLPTMKETKFLLPKPALSVRDVKPAQWVNMVQSNWHDVQGLSTIQAKAQVLDILSKWPLFGSSFFAVKRVSDPKERSEHILALNRHGVHFIDLVTHETLIHYPFSEVISTRKVKSEDGTLFLDMKCGNLMQQRITRLQTDQAHEISRLIRQYITMEQRLRHS